MTEPTEIACPHPARATAMLLLPLLVAMALPNLARAADDAPDPGWTLSGDLRAGYFVNQTTSRAGAESTSESVNARLRAAIERGLDDRWSVRVRAAARLSDDQDGTRAYLRGHAPTRTGTSFGDVTLDEAYLAYAAPDDGLRFRVGRFQTGFTLAGVTGKALDRADSASLDVTWTDGIHLDLPLGQGWRGHAIVEHRPASGWTGTVRAPLDFSDDDSRASLLLAVENPEPLGRLIQRVVTVTWMPSSMPQPMPGTRDDYGTIDAKVAAAWPLGESGRKFVAGVEVGHAFGTPRGAQVGTGGGLAHADGLAWQVAMSLYDIAPGHHLGLVHGRIGAGWLVSPDFRGNEWQTELRYQWRINPKTSMEARIRRRTEVRVPVGMDSRVDDDAFVRITHKF